MELIGALGGARDASKYDGIEERTCLRRINLPPKERNFDFQPTILDHKALMSLS